MLSVGSEPGCVAETAQLKTFYSTVWPPQINI